MSSRRTAAGFGARCRNDAPFAASWMDGGREWRRDCLRVRARANADFSTNDRLVFRGGAGGGPSGRGSAPTTPTVLARRRQVVASARPRSKKRDARPLCCALDSHASGAWKRPNLTQAVASAEAAAVAPDGTCFATTRTDPPTRLAAASHLWSVRRGGASNRTSRAQAVGAARRATLRHNSAPSPKPCGPGTRGPVRTMRAPATGTSVASAPGGSAHQDSGEGQTCEGRRRSRAAAICQQPPLEHPCPRPLVVPSNFGVAATRLLGRSTRRKYT